MKLPVVLSIAVGCSCALSCAAFTTMSAVTPRREFLKSAAVGTASTLASASLLGAASPAAAAGGGPPKVGSIAPDFTLPSNRGKDLKLSELVKQAKHTVVYFYPGDFTSGCTIEAQGFQKEFSKFKDLDAQIVGVSVDSVDKHLDFEKSYGLEFPLLSDSGAAVAEAYGSKLSIPFMGSFANRLTFIVSQDGKVEQVFTDVEGKVKQHASDVLAAIKALG